MPGLYSIYHTLKSLYALVSKNLVSGYALPPMNLVLELTYRCNLRCEMCYQENQVEKLNLSRRRKDELNFASIKRLIDQTPPWCLVIFSGGEPFVRSDIIEILSYATRKRRCHVVTNGTMIKPETARRLVQLNLLSIGVSIDGDQATHDRIRRIPGAYEKAIAAVREIKRFKTELGKTHPILNFKTTITPLNVEKLAEIYQTADEIGADYCTFQIMNNSMYLSALRLFDEMTPYYERPEPVSGVDGAVLDDSLSSLQRNSRSGKTQVRFIPGFSQEEIVHYYRNQLDISMYTCNAPWLGVNVSPTGDVFPCLNYRIGNVQDNGLMSLWNNSQFRRYRTALKRDGLFAGCLGCCDLERKA